MHMNMTGSVKLPVIGISDWARNALCKIEV